MRQRSLIQFITLAAVVVSASLTSGCATAPKPNATATMKPSSSAMPPAASDGRLIDPVDNPRGFSASNAAVAGVLPLSAIPYDNTVLPLVSPDGRFVATETGVPPSWSAILANPEGEIPGMTRIEIYQLDLRADIPPADRQPPTLVATVAAPALLGRSCDAEGFLIESPQEDGSRWIGKAAWADGQITWLVQGSDVNAFASLGPGGRLAWSRRSAGGERFDLVVRGPDSAGGVQEWTVPGQNADWLLPTWSGGGAAGDGLYVMSLEGGRLDLRYAPARDARTFLQSVQRLPICTDATIYTAYQMLAGQTGPAERSPGGREHIFYFHPVLSRMAIWRPLDLPGRRALYLNAKSFSALLDAQGYVLVCTQDDLIRQSLVNDHVRMNLVAGTQIPRSTPHSEWPYMLLRPGEGYVTLTAMKLLPLNATTQAALTAGTTSP